MNQDTRGSLVKVLNEIAVICTDRGQHKRIRLTTARKDLWTDGSTSWSMTHALRHFAAPDEDAEPLDVISRHSYTFICPLCRRNPAIEKDKWWSAIERLDDIHVREIDLSLVGF